MNIKLLKKIRREILRRPKQFNMNYWFRYSPKEISHCGTSACIAGWALTFGQKTTKPIDAAKSLESEFGTAFIFQLGRWNANITKQAEELLELTELQAQKLFFHTEWPENFKKAYIHGKTSTARAKAAAARIDHFIATEGME